MILYVDTTQNEIILAVADKSGKLIAKLSQKTDYNQSEVFLIALDKFLKKNKLKLSDIKKIMAVKGPGFFTGTRIGVTCANTLSFLLNVPILGVKSSESGIKDIISKNFQKITNKKSILPIYSSQPNITKKKK